MQLCKHGEQWCHTWWPCCRHEEDANAVARMTHVEQYASRLEITTVLQRSLAAAIVGVLASRDGWWRLQTWTDFLQCHLP
jgi:hypothetical protein